MKKIKNLISRHKFLAVICIVSVVFIIIMLYFFLSIMIGGNNKYGNRLDGINEVEISKDKMNSVKENLKQKEEVSESSVRIQGKIIYINIVFNNDVSVEKAKEIANGTLENFDDDEKSFYDFSYLLTQVGSDDENDEKTYFITAGTKHSKADTISYTKS